MPVDDPISALQTLNESDARQRSPIAARAKAFIDIIKLFLSPGDALTPGAMSAAVSWWERRSLENLDELVAVLASELQHRGTQIQTLIDSDQSHREFVERELPGLIWDALRRSQEIRAKDRLRRLATILAHAAGAGRECLADFTEEMFRIAMELDERDVLVLKEVVRCQAARIQQHTGRVRPFDAYSVFPMITSALSAHGFVEGEVDSICSKLESFGLVSRTERNVSLIADNPTPYALLKKGVDFLEYIKPAEDPSRASTTTA